MSELELDYSTVSSIPPLPGTQVDVLLGGVWVGATVLLSPNDHPDPHQRIKGWKVKMHVGTGFSRYIWDAADIRLSEGHY